MEIADGIWFIEGLNKGKFPYCNILKVGEAVIDAGAGIEIVKRIRAEKLILSHFHPDHSGGAWIFREILAPEGGEISIDYLARRYIAPDIHDIWKRFIKSTTGFDSFRCESFDDIITLKDHEIEAIPLRGHTTDHHVFLIDQKVIYGADVDLTGFGPFYGNPESDPYLFEKEIDKLFDLDFEVYVSSHREPIFEKEQAEEQIRVFKNKIKEREEKILEILETPKTLDEIVEISPIYGRKPQIKEILDFLERTMISKHLEKLEKENRVKREDGKFVRV